MIPVPQLLAQAALLARLAAPDPPTRSAVGETLRYEAKLGYFAVGTASVSVTRMVKERGRRRIRVHRIGRGRTARVAGCATI